MLDNQSLQIIPEGRLFEEQPLGGISRIYHEIFPCSYRMDEWIVFSILAFGHLRQPLPPHPQIIRYPSKFPPIHRLLRLQTVFWKLQDYLCAQLQIVSRHFISRLASDAMASVIIHWLELRSQENTPSSKNIHFFLECQHTSLEELTTKTRRS